MSSAATESQHKCSCGRTFRHGISLKRHQKVSGCPEMEGSVEIVTASLAPIAAPPIVEATDDESGPVVITAQQIARWQEQKNFHPGAPLAAPAPRASIDWEALRATGLEFVSFAAEQVSSAGRFGASMAQLAARFTLFGGFVVALGWLLLFGVSETLSAAPASAVDRADAAELAARSTVNSFLQTAQLDQYDRARDFLAAKTRDSVSAAELRAMFSNLPIAQAPESISSDLEQNGRVARVTVVRGGSAEVYTLVQEAQGWGLASVAIRRA
jgi:hypothetical protein